MQPQLTALVAGALAGWVAATGTDKGQFVRGIDVLILGPFLVLLGFGLRPLKDRRARVALIFAGAATVTFNLRNFLGTRRASGSSENRAAGR